jgi:hypothetical protein
MYAVQGGGIKNLEFYIDMKLLPTRRSDESSMYLHVQAVQVIVLSKSLNLCTVLIVILPCMLTITQLSLQQNAHFYC